MMHPRKNAKSAHVMKVREVETTHALVNIDETSVQAERCLEQGV